MAFSSEKKARTLMGNLVAEVHSFNAASVTSGNISAGVSTILHVSLQNNVTAGAGLAVSTGQAVALSGLTSNDTGTILVIGY